MSPRVSRATLEKIIQRAEENKFTSYANVDVETGEMPTVYDMTLDLRDARQLLGEAARALRKILDLAEWDSREGFQDLLDATPETPHEEAAREGREVLSRLEEVTSGSK